MELPSGPPNISDGTDGKVVDTRAPPHGYVPDSGLSEREWRIFSTAVRVCGNDCNAVAALCASQEFGKDQMTEEKVKEIMARTR